MKMETRNPIQDLILVILVASSLSLAQRAFAADSIKGQVLGGNAPIAKLTVTLWEANADAPKQLDQTKTNDDGRFEVRAKGAHSDAMLYLVANGGVPKASQASGDNPAIALLAMVGSNPPADVTINELTTVSSVFTAAQFIHDGAISGTPLGLRIMPGTCRTCTVANDDWRARFFQAATPTGAATPRNTLEAMAGIARAPWANASALYALFDEAYPQPKDAGSRRNAPFAPYLAYTPADLALSLCFSGGGNYAAGRLMFDADGNLWSGQNWLPGSQSGVIHGIGGGTIKFSPNGTALSAPITGFTGMGVDGIGWALAWRRTKSGSPVSTGRSV
jgi:hypothetical protein